MNRPLLVTDCDEVLLHMVSHFSDWLDEAHGVLFRPEEGDMAGALKFKDGGERVPSEQVWEYLTGFFRTEMHRQTIVPGAVEALGSIGEVADIVILTNLGEEAHGWRVEQLAGHGIHHEVVCNRGGKGEPLKSLVERHGATRSVFVDDLAVHHASVAKYSPDTFRLHMVAEPKLAAVTETAAAAHARIDDWPTATDWILERLKDAA
ncbi:HAD family hydrolase [Sphingomonas sp. BN140010]|uniref:HAD family hydrolase n=1 Tax=Sphingomonas arvum TaxID=2992113 RepID=A0ABT3JF05_9SPHN|nr:HAD family hydrolase [Sphingomonas sp. BN140010]MCW3797661.1 HAD family hydrolase [Sphingomonas sp. BN140010]